MDIIKLIFVIVGLIYALLMFFRPKTATYLLIFLCIFQFSWFTRYFGASDYLGRILYFFAMLLAVRIILDFMMRNIKIRKIENISYSMLIFILGFIGLTVSSNIYNQENMILGLYELRYYFIMIVLFFGIYYYSVLQLSMESFIKGLVLIGLLQIPFSIIQFILAGGGAYRTLDSVTGTFNNYGVLVFVTILTIGLLLNYKLETNKDIFKFNTYYFLFPLLIPLLLSKSRTGTGLILLMIGFVFAWASIRKKTKIDPIKATVLMCSLVLITGFIFYNFFWKRIYDTKSQFSIDYVASYFMREPRQLGSGRFDSMGRARAVYEATILISKNPVTVLVGRGSGSVSKASLLGKQGKYYYEVGPFVGIDRTQISKIIAENGTIGLFIFVYLFYSIWRSVWQLNINKEVVRVNFMIILLSFVIMSLYMQVLQSPFSALILSYIFAFIQSQMKVQRNCLFV